MTRGLRIAIAGVGAVGTVLAYHLIAAGHDVTLVARGRRAEQLREGLKIGGRPPRHAPVVCASALEPHDVVVLAVKETGLASMLEEIGHAILPDTLIVPLVNGVPFWFDHREHVAGRVIGAVVYITAALESDGTAHPGPRPRLILGVPEGPSPARLASFAEGLNDTGIETVLVDNIASHVWSKVALNLATNPLSVAAGADLQAQLSDPALNDIVRSILWETICLARAMGAEPSMGIDEMIATGVAAGPVRPSMLQDFNAGRKLELKAIAWKCLQLAEKYGVEMPVTRTIANLARFSESAEPRTSAVA